MILHFDHGSAQRCMRGGDKSGQGFMRVLCGDESLSGQGCMRVHLDRGSALRCKTVHLDRGSALGCTSVHWNHVSALG